AEASQSDTALSQTGESQDEDRAGGRKRRRCDASDQNLDTIVRMNKLGMSTDMIAKALDISEGEVVGSLVKRRRAEGAAEENSTVNGVRGNDGEGDRREGDSEHEAEAVSSLVTRLLTDPLDLCCPILQSLLEDPVVAEDGNTYEREAIEGHLIVRQQSPMTNTAMGKQVQPNQGVKTQVVNYKEKTVSEIISVVPRIPSGEGAKLLRRAEDFIRPRLPDSGARTKLLQLLHLRADLPTVLRGDAVKELLQMLVDGKDDQPLAALLGRFDALHIGSVMPSLGEKTIKRLHAVAREGSLAKTTGVAAEVLEYAAIYLQDRRSHSARAQELLKTNLGLNCSADAASFPDLAKILLELACRQEDDKEAQQRLLFQARAADPTNEAVRHCLVEVLSEVLGVEGKDQNEGLLLTMLFEEHQKVPEHLLPKLQLEPAQLKQLKPTWLVVLAEQLAAANRSTESACVAIAAAQAHEAAGNKEAAQQAYILAYGMDRSNEDASHGVVEMCSATTQRCSQLEAQNQQLRVQLASLAETVSRLDVQVRQQKGNLPVASSVEWDVSSLDVSQFVKGQSKESPRFNLAGSGVEAWLKFYPKGDQAATAGKASLYVRVSTQTWIDCELFLDHRRKPVKRRAAEGSYRHGYRNFGDTADKYDKVGIIVKQVELSGSGLKLLVS
ncbi:unnamed protein product, partial [Polarella glacialis]